MLGAVIFDFAGAIARLQERGVKGDAVEKVDLDAGTIDMQNPWGREHVRGLSVEDFKKYYTQLRIGK